MSDSLELLELRLLITQKEAAIAEANMQTSREGWTCDWTVAFDNLDRLIEEKIAKIKAESNFRNSDYCKALPSK